MSLIYFDQLDTVRTARSLDGGVDSVAVEDARASIMMWLLSGHTPVLSQSQAFDSTLILDSLMIGEPSNFRKLITDGWIRFSLIQNNQSVLQAFLAALRTPKLIFSAWPELNELTPHDRARIAEEIERTGKSPVREVEGRIDAIHRLDSDLTDLSVASHLMRAQPPKFSMNELVKNALEPADENPLSAPLAPLRRLEAKSRTGFYDDVERLQLSPPLARKARDLVDACYNQIVGESVGAGKVLVTPNGPDVLTAVFRSRGTSKEPVMGLKTEEIRKPLKGEKDTRDALKATDWGEILGVVGRAGYADPNNAAYSKRVRAEATDLLVSKALKNQSELRYMKIGGRLVSAAVGVGIGFGITALLSFPPAAAGLVAGTGLLVPTNAWKAAVTPYFNGPVKKRFAGFLEDLERKA